MTSNVIAQLVSTEGETAGPQLDLPHDITTEQLETLLNDLLKIVRAHLILYAYFFKTAHQQRSRVIDTPASVDTRLLSS